MVTPTVSKLINKLAWTARRFGRAAPIDVLYQGGSKDRPEYIKRIRRLHVRAYTLLSRRPQEGRRGDAQRQSVEQSI